MHRPVARRHVISSLWTMVALNIAFADILGLYTPGTLPEVMSGVIEGVALSDNLMLIAAVFIQIPIAMIVATQLLAARTLRLVSLVAVLVTALFIIGGGSLKPHYIFFALCEIAALAAIAVLVWGEANAEPRRAD
ncbi:hypothetical protein C8N43_1079 [Litoreibacter ponti]|uniref:DoxX-like protein n=1 Tax=Litoreibacter ponti TaxID=1510457 RepID=A0A2T6BK26_9RHOB|nr:DUF6326 family protein [Litoreibacter ponti]PTX56420.1 hypothetical protein C8N43_1079 [Litoreibacter ponti]